MISIFKVFTNEKGLYGNKVAIIPDEKSKINTTERRRLCRKLKLSEAVFINNLKNNNISIFSPTGEIPFAGHAVLGTAFYLDEIKKAETKIINCLGNKIVIYHNNSLIWAKADFKILPHWIFRKCKSKFKVEKIRLTQTKTYKHCFVWAWEDYQKKIIRARTFAPDWLIPEDEANGSGSLVLASKLKRNIKIIHGKGSVIFANYLNNKAGKIGGRVRLYKEIDM